MQKGSSSNKNFFWPSYVDLMTSLFVVMLVLFIVSYWLYDKKLTENENDKQRLLVLASRAKKIDEIANSVQALPTDLFEFQEKYKRHKLKINVEFPPGSSDIPETYHAQLVSAGKEIEKLINSMKEKYQDTIKYLVIIEGQASTTPHPDNYGLSYSRAKALYNFWETNSVRFDPDVCELLLAGSGTGGVGRDPVDIKNQRFLIQIIPKVGEVK